MAYNKGLPPSDPQTNIKRVHKAPSDPAQASSNLDEAHAGFDKNTRASYNLANWQGIDAQHPLGPFIPESSSHDTVLVNTEPPHPTASILSGSDGLPAFRKPDKNEHAMFWGAQEVSFSSIPGLQPRTRWLTWKLAAADIARWVAGSNDAEGSERVDHTDGDSGRRRCNSMDLLGHLFRILFLGCSCLQEPEAVSPSVGIRLSV